jgi:amino acid adenylation domain-containing protein
MTRHLSQLGVMNETDLNLRTWEPGTEEASTHAEFYPTNYNQEVWTFEVEQSIPSCFERQVAASRKRLAVRTAGYDLTYDALNRWANRISRSITGVVTPGTGVVAILLNHDAPLIAAIVGVLKSGNCYVAMEPSHPVERLRKICEDSEAVLLITDTANSSLTRSIMRDQCVLLNLDALPLDVPDDDLELEIPPSALAHIVYTSGSTGIPKGVCQSHGNVLHNVRNYTSASRMTAADRCSLLSLCCYAPSVSDIFAALLNGAAVLPFKIAEMGPAKMGEWLRREEISVYHSVPLVFRNMASAVTDQRGFPHLRLIKLGGEPVLRSDVDLFKQHFSDRCRLYVGLGTSETNIIRCMLLDKQTEIDGYTVPAGFAVEGKEVVLLDDNQREVPVGEIGEIAVGSLYLFKGYWRKPELTEASFVPDPRCSGQRLFRTGDMGRMLPDGTLLHLGRRDSQIKIRGVRIDPSEVESAVKELPEVRDCVVIALQDEPGETQLVAYLIAKTDEVPNTSTLRMQMAEKLPSELIPSAFVWLDRIPLTLNGKVDRNALPRPKKIDFGEQDRPKDLLELKLISVWQRLFKLENIGRHDNFFDLGGHSLLAAQLVAEIEFHFGCKLPISVLLQMPTVESLARRLAREDWKPVRSSLVPLQPLGARPPLFIAPGWGGSLLWFINNFREEFAPDQPVYGLQTIGLDGEEERDASIEEMASHYVNEIRASHPEGPYYLAGYSMGGLIAFEIAQQLRRQGQRVAFLGLLDTSPQSVPWTVYALTFAPYFWQRLQLHVKQLRATPVRESLGYVRERWETLRWWISKNRRRSKVVTMAPEIDISVPQAPGIQDYYIALADAYRPRRYPGSIDVFFSEAKKLDMISTWSRLARAGATLHQLAGNHTGIIGSEYGPATAKTMKAALGCAQQDALPLHYLANKEFLPEGFTPVQRTVE